MVLGLPFQASGVKSGSRTVVCRGITITTATTITTGSGSGSGRGTVDATLHTMQEEGKPMQRTKCCVWTSVEGWMVGGACRGSAAPVDAGTAAMGGPSDASWPDEADRG